MGRQIPSRLLHSEVLSYWFHLGLWEPFGGVLGFFMGSRGRNRINSTLYSKKRLEHLQGSNLESGLLASGISRNLNIWTIPNW